MAHCVYCGDETLDLTTHDQCWYRDKIATQEDLPPEEARSAWAPCKGEDDEKVPVKMKHLDMSNY